MANILSGGRESANVEDRTSAMGEWKVTINGETFKVNAPANTSETMIKAAAQKQYRESKSLLGEANAAVRGASQGAMMNFGDEISSAANAFVPLDRIHNPNIKSIWDGVSPAEAFRANMQEEKENERSDAARYSGAAGVGNVAGAIGSAILTGGIGSTAAKGAAKAVAPKLAAKVGAKLATKPITRAVLANAAVGAPLGYVAGFGAGDTMENRKKSAGTGAAAGAALGGAVGGTVRGLGPVVSRYWNAFKGTGAEEEALIQLRAALRRDGYDVDSPEGVQALQQELSKFTGKPVSLADAGNASRARAGVGLRSPSEVQSQSIDQVLAREAEAGERLAGDIKATVAPRVDVHALDDALVAQRDNTALPLRQKALTEEAPLDYNNPSRNPRIEYGDITDAERAAMETYKQGGKLPSGKFIDAEELNYALRSGTATPEMQAFADTVRGVLAKSKLAEPARAYRGLQQHGQNNYGSDSLPVLRTGEELPSPAFNSTTTDRRAAKQFTEYGDGGGQIDEGNPSRFLRVDIPKGAPAYGAFDDGGMYGGEGELLLGPGKFNVERARTFEGNYLDAPGEHQAAFAKFIPEGMQAGIRARIVDDHVLQGLARLAQPSIKEAREAAALERDMLNVQGLDTSHLPDFPESGAPLDMKALDYLKRHLDGQVSRYFNSTDPATKAKANGLKELRNAIRGRMREAVPEYGEYLDAYAGPQELREALDEGRQFIKQDPEVIARAQAERSEAGQEFARVGAARALTDVLDNNLDKTPASGRILNTNNARKRVEALGLEGDNAARLNTAVGQEVQLNKLTQEITGGKADMNRAARDEAPMGNGIYNPTSAVSVGSWVSRKLAQAADLRKRELVNEAYLPRALEQDPAAIGKIVNELKAQGKWQEARDLMVRARMKFGTNVSSRIIGGAVGLEEE